MKKKTDHEKRFAACQRHILKGVQLGLTPENINIADADGNTLLHIATAEFSNRIVKMLLANGANVNALGANGMTPLHLAASNLSYSLVKLLIASGADVNAVNDSGCTPLHYGIGEPTIVMLLLKKGANVDAKDAIGRTPLHFICLKRTTGRLLSSFYIMIDMGGANINSLTNDGETPLRLATLGHQEDIIVLLRNAGAVE